MDLQDETVSCWNFDCGKLISSGNGLFISRGVCYLDKKVGTTNQDWWPNRLRLEILHQHSSKSNPMGEGFNYAREFKSLDLQAVKRTSMN